MNSVQMIRRLPLPFLLLLLLMASALQSKAREGEAYLTNPIPLSDFYLIDEEQSLIASNQFKQNLDPIHAAENLFSEFPKIITTLEAKVLSLLQFSFHHINEGDSIEPYDRMLHFGGWIHDKRDATCFNTRAKVLIRDSKDQVGLNSKGCTVLTGRWDEPYTGNEVAQAHEIQIDHFVPLKNAYISGAFKWNFEKRCLYANFLGNTFHLVSADATENQRKSDRTPERYMPPNQGYSCQYLAQWLKVKLIWNLSLIPSEKEALLNLIEQNHCHSSDFEFTLQELNQQKKFMNENMNLCQ
jgi:hypothetical protein